MAIPTYDALMLPLLKLSAERLWSMRELIARISDDLNLTMMDREEMIPSGSITTIASRIHWAKTYLKQAGLVEQPRRGTVQITQRGREVLSHNPDFIDNNLLQKFDEFRSFQRRTRVSIDPQSPATVPVVPVATIAATPEEQIASASATLDALLREALLSRVLETSPKFFEQTIVDLLLAMGYGGSRSDAGEQLGGTGDGGVDGVIREDQLGLDRVYLQAKRYQPGSSVGSEVVHGFMGALVARGAQKGVLITTSHFTRSALAAATQSGHLRIVLIDGEELTRLMIRFGVGVRLARSVEVREIDRNYFEPSDQD